MGPPFFAKLKIPFALTDFFDHQPRQLGSLDDQFGLGRRSRPVMEFWIIAVELRGQQECVFAQMQFVTSAHPERRAWLLPGKHAYSLVRLQHGIALS
jgi:hypothetical protein